MILCLCSKSIHTRYYYRNDRAILLEEPRKSADLCSSVLLIITRKRLHPDSIQLFRFEFVIRYERKFPICRSLLQCVFALCDTVTLTISPDSHCWTTYRDGLSICQVWRFYLQNSRFGFTVRTDRHTQSHSDVDNRYTHATTVDGSNNNNNRMSNTAQQELSCLGHRRRQQCVLGHQQMNYHFSSLPFPFPPPSPLHGGSRAEPPVYGVRGITPEIFLKFNTRFGAFWCSLATIWWLCTSLQFSHSWTKIMP